MIRVRSLLVAALLASSAACFPPERDNKYDPDGTVDPHVDILEAYAVSCAQWTDPEFPFPPGFTVGLLSDEEQTEIGVHCAQVCDGHPFCQDVSVLTSAVRSPPARCSEESSTAALRYNEILYEADAERRIELILPHSVDLGADDLGERAGSWPSRVPTETMRAWIRSHARTASRCHATLAPPSRAGSCSGSAMRASRISGGSAGNPRSLKSTARPRVFCRWKSGISR